MSLRSGNPTLKKNTFDSYIGKSFGEQMTLEGTINKTIFLSVLLFASALFSWNAYHLHNTSSSIFIFGILGAFIIGLVASLSPKTTPITAPLYAILEGLGLGYISAYYNSLYHGIVLQAVLLTVGVLFSLLFIYKFRLIHVSENFRIVIIAATFGIAILYLMDWILNIFGMNVPYINQTGLIGILFSLFVVVIASLNLVLDFYFIENASNQGVPKYFEWYGAFGLMVTLVWLYLEILRLLAKLNRR